MRDEPNTYSLHCVTKVILMASVNCIIIIEIRKQYIRIVCEASAFHASSYRASTHACTKSNQQFS